MAKINMSGANPTQPSPPEDWNHTRVADKLTMKTCGLFPRYIPDSERTGTLSVLLFTAGILKSVRPDFL